MFHQTTANVVPDVDDQSNTNQPPHPQGGQAVGGGGTTRARRDGNIFHTTKLAKSPETSDVAQASNSNFIANMLRGKAPFAP